MPLRKGGAKATVGANIRRIVHDWEKDGTIGSSHPPDKAAAVKQAVAISLETARGTARGRTKQQPPKPGSDGTSATGPKPRSGAPGRRSTSAGT